MIVYQDGQRCVHQLVLNQIRTNCYVLEMQGRALLIDPSDQAGQIVALLQARGLRLAAMLATHAHFDHVGAAGGIVDAGLAEGLHLHALDLPEYKRANSYAMLLQKRRIQQAPVVAFSADLHSLLQGFGLAVVHAGGHTPGSCSLQDLAQRFLITGDLALHHSIQPTLFDRRENTAQWAGFVDQVQQDFDASAVLLPGHGAASTVGQEVAHNRKWQYVRQQRQQQGLQHAA